MKKRVLSMLLALALCFTVFAGMAMAKPETSVQRMVDRVDNVRTKIALDGQKELLDESIKPVEVDVNEEGVWKEIADTILNDTVLEKDKADVTDKTVTPYFFLRWLEEQYDGNASPEVYEVTEDIHDYPTILNLVERFKEINTTYDTSTVGLKAAMTLFEDYSEDIGDNLLLPFMEDVNGQLDLLLYLGIISEVESDITFNLGEDNPDASLTDALEDIQKKIASGEFDSLEDALKYLNEIANGNLNIDPDHPGNPDLVESGAKYDAEEAKAQIDEIGKLQARKEVGDLLQLVANFVTSGDSGEEYEFQQSEGKFLTAYRAIMQEDEPKKNGAILVGMETIDFLTSGLRQEVINFVRDNINVDDKNNDETLTGKIYNYIGENVSDGIFSADPETAVNAAHELMKMLVGYVQDNAETNSTIDKFMGALEARGLGDLNSLYDIEEKVVKTIDTSDVGMGQNIWFNLGLGRVLEVESVPGNVMNDSADLDEYNPTVTQTVAPKFAHRFISKFTKSGTDNPQALQTLNKDETPKYFYMEITDPKLDGNDIEVTEADGVITATVEKYGMTFLQGTNGGVKVPQLIYDATKIPKDDPTLTVTVYRGPDAFDHSSTYHGYERYVTTAVIELTTDTAPEPTKPVITLEQPNGEKYGSTSGAEITIQGDPADYELISIYIKAPEGKRFLYMVVDAAEYMSGVTFKLPNPAPLGTYTVYAGVGDNLVSKTFEVIADEDVLPQIVKEGDDFAKVTGSFSGTKGKAWDTLKNVPTEVELLSADGKTSIQAPVTWQTKADEATGYKGYVPTELSAQTINGTYDVDALKEKYKDQYEILDNLTELYGDKAIDGKVTLSVDLSKSSPTGGRGSSTYANFIDEEMSFNGSTNALTVKGETNMSKTLIEVVGPDGKTVLKSYTATGSELRAGFVLDLSDIAPLAPGVYTVNLKDPSTGQIYDTYTFTVGAVDFMVEDHINYVMGYEDGTIRPEANVTRDQVAAMLFRLLNDNYRNGWLTNSTNKFSDLTDDMWSMTPIATMNTAGIVNGYPDGTFGTGKPITRAEFAAMCARMGAFTTADANPYSDIDDSWAKEEIKHVTAMGWFQGSDGKFRPNDYLTRAEAITVINRMLGRDKVTVDSFKSMTVPEFADLSADAWYYAAIIEAATAHDHEISNGVEIWTKTETAEDWTTFEK